MVSRKDLDELKFQLGVLEKINCNVYDSEQYKSLIETRRSLPQGIFRDDVGGFYRVVETDLSKEERDEYIAYRQAKDIHTIKNCVVFFAVLTAISLVSGLLWILTQ